MTDTPISPQQKTLVVDTCALLDIVRAPIRASISSEQVRNALVIEEALRGGAPPIRVIVCGWVADEYERNIDGVVLDVRQRLKSMWNNHRQATDVMAVFQGNSPAAPNADAWISEVIDHGQRVAKRIIKACSQLNATADDERLATLRIRDARPPSHKGKASLADAVVTKLALRITREDGLGSDGRPQTVLLSSNTNDFCDGKWLKRDLQREFDAVGLNFVTTWSAARYFCLPPPTERLRMDSKQLGSLRNNLSIYFRNRCRDITKPNLTTQSKVACI